MLKRILFSALFILFIFNNNLLASSIDSSYFSHLKAYDWQPISDVEKVLQYEKAKELTKRTLDQSKLADGHYVDGVKKMKANDFNGAIKEFKAAMKRYKRAKLSDNALNYIRTNMALCYAYTGNKQDIVAAKRYIDLVTTKIESDVNWNYNVAIVKNKTGDQLEATKILSTIIKKEDNFQAYVTLAAIYAESGNDKEAEKVKNKMFKAEDKLNQQNSKNISAKNSKTVKSKKKKKKKIVVNPRGKKPDVANLNITAKDDPLKFNKIEKIDDRSLIQIQQGIAEYNDGITALRNKNYKSAQNKLKEAEKRLKRGKITVDGLNFSRGNLAIALLASGDKRGVGQAKRYLNNITSKIYKDRNWAYNLAVAHYDFGSRSKGATKEDFINKSIKLFKTAIQKEKLNLPAYQNLVYIYNTIGEKSKALSAYKAFLKAEETLLNEYNQDDQKNLGMDVLSVYRIKLGTYGVFDAPIELYDQEYLITVPINEKQTGFFAGKFYNLKDAQKYQKKMQKNGFESASISSFREGEVKEF